MPPNTHPSPTHHGVDEPGCGGGGGPPRVRVCGRVGQRRRPLLGQLGVLLGGEGGAQRADALRGGGRGGGAGGEGGGGEKRGQVVRGGGGGGGGGGGVDVERRRRRGALREAEGSTYFRSGREQKYDKYDNCQHGTATRAVARVALHLPNPATRWPHLPHLHNRQFATVRYWHTAISMRRVTVTRARNSHRGSPSPVYRNPLPRALVRYHLPPSSPTQSPP